MWGLKSHRTTLKVVKSHGHAYPKIFQINPIYIKLIYRYYAQNCKQCLFQNMENFDVVVTYPTVFLIRRQENALFLYFKRQSEQHFQ